MLDPGGPSAAAAAGEDDLESVGLLRERDESHFSQRISFGSASTRTAWCYCHSLTKSTFVLI